MTILSKRNTRMGKGHKNSVLLVQFNMAESLDSLASYYIEDKPIILEELGRGAYAVVKKVGHRVLVSVIA